MEAMIMNHRKNGICLSISLYFLLGLLCMASLAGCTDANKIPTSKIDKAYSSVTISWDNVPETISYNIYFSSISRAAIYNRYKIPNASNPITVTDLVIGKTYYFGISLVDELGESIILSEEAYTATEKDGLVNFGKLTPKIQNLKGQVNKTKTREGQVTLSWDKMPNAVSYNIYYGESQGVAKQKGKKIANVNTPYVIKGLKRGIIYYFVVTAATNFGESKESKELSLTVK
jgi:fibronectin type 3 domain-containing protein